MRIAFALYSALLATSAVALPGEFDGENCRVNQYIGITDAGESCFLNLTTGRRAPQGGDVSSRCIESELISGNLIIEDDYAARWRRVASLEAIEADIAATGCTITEKI